MHLLFKLFKLLISYVVFNLSLLRGGSEPTTLGTSVGTLEDWKVSSVFVLLNESCSLKL